MVYTILVIVQVVIALVLVGLILVQHGKGADAGAAFGSGASGTVFGAKGSANFMTRATAALATVFFAISLTLAYLVNDASVPTGSVIDQAPTAPGTSLLSDPNENGVPGDEALTGDSPQSGAGNSDSGVEAAVPSAATGDGNAGDTGARVPE